MKIQLALDLKYNRPTPQQGEQRTRRHPARNLLEAEFAARNQFMCHMGSGKIFLPPKKIIYKPLFRAKVSDQTLGCLFFPRKTTLFFQKRSKISGQDPDLLPKKSASHTKISGQDLGLFPKTGAHLVGPKFRARCRPARSPVCKAKKNTVQGQNHSIKTNKKSTKKLQFFDNYKKHEKAK